MLQCWKDYTGVAKEAVKINCFLRCTSLPTVPRVVVTNPQPKWDASAHEGADGDHLVSGPVIAPTFAKKRKVTPNDVCDSNSDENLAPIAVHLSNELASTSQ